jgi:hypothetical protein
VSGAATLEAGATTKLTAVAKDATGATITGVTFTWSSSDPAMMSVANDGTVSALRIGAAKVTATAANQSGSLDLTSSLTPYTFSFPGGTPDAEAQRIKDAVQFGHAFFKTAFGRTITKATSVVGAASAAGCDSRSGAAAFAAPQSVTFCVSNQGWTANGPKMRQKITIHELFHVWQYEYQWLGIGHDGAAWVTEGSAELVGFYGVDGMGLIPLATSRGCNIKENPDFKTRNPPGLPPLSNVESVQAWQTTQGPLYALAFTAMDQLTTSGGGIASLKTYSDAIAANSSTTGWQAAFQTAFGTSTSAFYGQYPTYYNTLPVPSAYLCGV